MIVSGMCILSIIPAKAVGIDEESPEVIQKEASFLQTRFDKIIPFEFKKENETDSAIQGLPSQPMRFDYDGRHYCGFKFKFPEWADGDFSWMYLFAKTAANKEFSAGNLRWFILPEKGEFEKGEVYFQPITFPHKYPQLRERFPYSSTVVVQNFDRNRLVPGKTYAIWFCFDPDDMPDFAISMTIDSDRGAKEFGKLPLK